MITHARFHRLWDARPVFLACIGLTVAAIVGQTWWAIAQDRSLTLEQETASSIAAIRTIEEHAARTVQDAERAVGAAIDTIRASDNGVLTDEVRLRDIMIRQRQETAHIQSLRFINLENVSAVTTFAYPTEPINIGDRTYVKDLVASTDPLHTVVGHPVKSRYDNKWILPVGRNMFDRSDKRLGSIVAYINIPYFSQFYDRVARDRHGVVSLQTADGVLIVRSPYVETLIGQDLSASPINRRITAGGIEGAFVSDTLPGVTERSLYAFRRVGMSPVIAVYSRDLEDVLAGWRSRSENRIAFAGMTICLIGVLTFFLMMHIARLQRSEERLSASETRYRALYESASDGIVLINRAYSFVHCNPAALRMFGAAQASDFAGRTVNDFSPMQSPHAADRIDVRARVDAAFAGTPQFFEWTSLRAGQPACDEVSLSLANIEDEPMLFCVFRDITARKKSELLQEGQNLILHLIGTDAELDEILHQIVRFIERAAPKSHCIIMLVADDHSRFTKGIGAAISSQTIVRLAASTVGEECGSISEALVTKCPVIVDDLTKDAVLAHLLNGDPGQPGSAGSPPDGSDAAVTYRASGSWPIMSKRGHILGIFSVFNQEAGIPGNEEMMLVGIGTDLAGIAIEGKIADDTIRHLAHHDELTGLPNRFLYTEHLEKALSHGARSQSAVGVLFLDLDRFKYINDSFGHVAGDTVLKEIASRFQRCLRETDVIARVGGDEFIVLVDAFGSPHDLGEIAQRLLYQAVQPFEIDDQECQLSVSIGIATYPLDGNDARTLLKHADIAMYRAKATGKNNYQFYSAAMNTHTIDRLAMETRLRRAIERREFVVYYQPKVDVASGRIAGAEALVRWMHPERGLLFPGDFIGLAEEAGLIGAIGLQVIERACAGIDFFRASGIPFGRVAINLSARQFNEAGLLQEVDRILAERAIDPSSLEFEITESMVMNNREEAIGLMDRMRERGISLSIDDFGTGYSSLAYLKRFPVDSVKADKSFINDIPGDANDSAIVQAIIVMAHTLGLKVTAEGVETATQLETLRRFGCDEYQGWYFSKAVPEAEFLALLEQQHAVLEA